MMRLCNARCHHKLSNIVSTVVINSVFIVCIIFLSVNFDVVVSDIVSTVISIVIVSVVNIVYVVSIVSVIVASKSSAMSTSASFAASSLSA